MGWTWGPRGPHVGPMNFAIWLNIIYLLQNTKLKPVYVLLEITGSVYMNVANKVRTGDYIPDSVDGMFGAEMLP